VIYHHSQNQSLVEAGPNKEKSEEQQLKRMMMKGDEMGRMRLNECSEREGTFSFRLFRLEGIGWLKYEKIGNKTLIRRSYV
jgi:hypothetical protein